MHHFNKLGVGQGHTLKLTDNGISTLLLLLSNLGGYPAYLLQVLQALDADNHVFNSELEALKEDERGHTVLSRWLWTRQVRLRHYAMRPQDGMWVCGYVGMWRYMSYVGWGWGWRGLGWVGGV